MIFGPIDTRTPNAPAWVGHPGWVVYAVTSDAADAIARAAQVAAERGAPLAPGTWPLDTPTDTQRISVGPVYVAIRTRRGHENGAPLATYYVLRRWMADEDVQTPDPAWPVSSAEPPADAAAPAPASWPFVAVGRRTSRAGTRTLGANVITWRGRLAGRTITFSTQPRKVRPYASFRSATSARIHRGTEHPEFVDVLVHHPLGDAERAELATLAQAHDPRPVVVRCVGERLREPPAAGRRLPEDAPSAPGVPDGATDA